MRTSMAVAEEEEEEFYELMDRILSSSCSSTSASNDDADHQHHRRVPRLPPPVAASYDVWISEPSSVKECRHRLLQHMGLAADPGLSHARPAAMDDSNSGLADVGRSISCDGLRPRPDLSLIVAEPVFAQSRSEGFVDPNLVHRQQPFRSPLLFGAAIPNKPPLGRLRESIGNLAATVVVMVMTGSARSRTWTMSGSSW